MYHHRTDALYRVYDVDRYDDRDIIATNLIESYDRLMAFIVKHLDDRFYLEDDRRIDIRNIIGREICVNLLIHREFIEPFYSRLIIEKDVLKTEIPLNRVDTTLTTPITTLTTLTETQQKILKIISENKKVTRSQIAEKIGITKDGVQYNLNILKEKNYIERIGNANNGYWKIIK